MFKKYQHIERLGTQETEGLLHGQCWVFPKLDGANAQIWFQDGQVHCGTRNQSLGTNGDFRGLGQWAKQSFVRDLFDEQPDWHLYGEWLVPHTLRTYHDKYWNEFHVFDVMCNGEYLSYNDYHETLEYYGFYVVPPICVVHDPTIEWLTKLLPQATYGIKDGQGTGEGIVVKNYNYINPYGRVTWGKIVANEFKAKHNAREPQIMTAPAIYERYLAETFLTETLVRKTAAKIAAMHNGWESRFIPQLLGTVWHDFVTEEIWAILKKGKNPRIDFAHLHRCITQRTKQLAPDIFGLAEDA